MSRFSKRLFLYPHAVDNNVPFFKTKKVVSVIYQGITKQFFMNKKTKKEGTEKVESEGTKTIVLTVDEIVAYTGYKKSYIYKLVYERKIPAHKPMFGRKLFFNKEEIDAWLLSTRLLTVNEIFNS